MTDLRSEIPAFAGTTILSQTYACSSDDDDYRVRSAVGTVGSAGLQYGPACGAFANTVRLRWITALSPAPLHEINSDQDGYRGEDGSCDDNVHGDLSGLN